MVTSPAKAVLGFASQNSDRVDFRLATFERQTQKNGLGKNKFASAARALGLPVEIIPEAGRFDVQLLARLSRVLTEQKPALVQTHAVKSHFLMSLVRSRDFKWVAFHHGYTAEDFKMKAYQQLDRWSLPKADRVVTVCKPFADQLVKRGVRLDSVSVIPNAIDPAVLQAEPGLRTLTRAKFSIRDDEMLALAIGRLSPEKGHSYLIKAVAQARSVGAERGLKLLIAGDGPLKAELSAEIERLGLRDVVRLIGHSEVQPLLCAADLLVLPSLSEGSPLVLLEAMAARVPIVATRVGGVPETIVHGESGVLVPSADPTALSQAILDISADPDRATRFAANAYDRATTVFTPEIYNQRILQICSEVLAADSH